MSKPLVIDIDVVNNHAVKEAENRINNAQKQVMEVLDQAALDNGITDETVGAMGMSPGEALGKAIFGQNKDIKEKMIMLVAQSLLAELMSKIGKRPTLSLKKNEKSRAN